MAFSLGSSGGGLKRRYGGGHSTLSEINIVPLVDVVLVLLIIFMLTAHVMEFGLEINVPEVKNQVKDSTEELPVISITRDGRSFLNDRPVNINLIPAEVARRFKGAKEVYVMADRATTWDPIAQVISQLNQAKIGIKVVAKPRSQSCVGDPNPPRSRCRGKNRICHLRRLFGINLAGVLFLERPKLLGFARRFHQALLLFQLQRNRLG